MTKLVEFTGRVQWCKPWASQIDREYEDERRGGNWSTDLVIDDKQAETFNSFGSKAKVREGNVIKVRRYERASYGELTPPKVTGVEEGTLIGNDSLCNVVVAVYTTKDPKGRPVVGIRWESIEVLELHEYVDNKPIKAGEAPPF